MHRNSRQHPSSGVAKSQMRGESNFDLTPRSVSCLPVRKQWFKEGDISECSSASEMGEAESQWWLLRKRLKDKGEMANCLQGRLICINSRSALAGTLHCCQIQNVGWNSEALFGLPNPVIPVIPLLLSPTNSAMSNFDSTRNFKVIILHVTLATHMTHKQLKIGQQHVSLRNMRFIVSTSYDHL